MITVVAAIILKDNKVLIAKRKPEKRLGGHWEFPGGKVEDGEDPVAAIKREINEELGIQISVDKYLGESVYQYDFGAINLKGYMCNYISGEILLNDYSEIKWIGKSEFYNYKMAPADLPFVQKVELF